MWLGRVVVRRYIDILIIGASLSELHTYRTAVKNLLYKDVPYVRPASDLAPQRTRKRATRNVEPASTGSKVNNIDLVLRFS